MNLIIVGVGLWAFFFHHIFSFVCVLSTVHLLVVTTGPQVKMKAGEDTVITQDQSRWWRGRTPRQYEAVFDGITLSRDREVSPLCNVKLQDLKKKFMLGRGAPPVIK